MNPETIILTNSDGTTREMSFEQFESILNSRLRSVVTSEGSIQAKLTTLTPYTDEETGEERLIGNFNAITSDQIPAIQAALAEGDFQTALNTTLSTNFRPDSSRFIPAVGEVCKLGIGTVDLREEGKSGLRIISVSPMPKATTKSFSLADLLSSAAAPVVSEPSSAITAETIQSADATSLSDLAVANGVDISAYVTSAGKVKASSVQAVKDLLVAELV